MMDALAVYIFLFLAKKQEETVHGKEVFHETEKQTNRQKLGKPDIEINRQNL